jgi:hypothetical protein
MQRSGHSIPPISSFVDDDRHAVLERTVGQRVFLLLGIVVIVMMVLAAGPVPVGHRIATWLARLLAPAPALVFLTNGLPWWRWGPWSYGAILLAGCVAVAAATTVATHRHRTARLLVVPVLAFAALAIDQLTGARLQLSSPLGESPLAAGRFSGMGNLDFAVMATSALIVAALVSARLRRGPAVLTAMALVVVAIVVDGAPQLGNDIGGVVTLIPAGFMLIALVADVTVTRLRVVTAVATTVTVAVGIALADYSRPPAAQTHVGRFVGQVLHGGAGTEVHRKFDAAIATFGWTTGTFVVGFTLAAWAIAHRRIMASLRQVPGATAAAVSAATLAVLGAALNDSGLGVAAMVVMVGVSALYAGFHPADRQTPVLSAPRGT